MVDDERSQIRNRGIARERLAGRLANALVPQRPVARLDRRSVPSAADSTPNASAARRSRTVAAPRESTERMRRTGMITP